MGTWVRGVVGVVGVVGTSGWWVNEDSGGGRYVWEGRYMGVTGM